MGCIANHDDIFHMELLLLLVEGTTTFKKSYKFFFMNDYVFMLIL